MLDILCGRFQPTLEDRLIQNLLNRPAGSLEPVLVVVPSRRLVDRLQQRACSGLRIAGSQNPSDPTRYTPHATPLLNIHFHTFRSLAFRILEEEGIATQPHAADPLIFEEIVRTLIARQTFRSFSFVQEGPPFGLPAALSATLKDLRDALVDPEQALIAAAENQFGNNSEHAKEIFTLLKAHQAALKALKLLPVSELTAMATQAAASSSYLARFPKAHYYGFYDLTVMQTEFFKSVSRRLPTTLYFPYEEENPAYTFAKRFLDEVLRGFATSIESIPSPLEGEGGGRRDAVSFGDRLNQTARLWRAEDRRMRGDDNQPLTPTLSLKGRGGPAISVVSASGLESEAAHAAKTILKWRAEGVAWKEMGIAQRGLEQYGPSVARALERHQIPFHSSGDMPLWPNPAVQSARLLLRLMSGPFTAQTLLDLADSPMIQADAIGLARALVRPEQWLEELHQRGVEPGSPLQLDRIEGGFLVFAKTIYEARAQFPKEASCEDWTGHLEALLRRFLENSGELDQVIALLHRFRGLTVVTPRLPRARFIAQLVDALQKLPSSSGISPQNGVALLDAMAARGQRFRRLIVLGLNDGIFPRTIREDPFLRDDLRQQVYSVLGNRLGQKLHGFEEESLLFELLMGSAEEQIVISYQRSDEEGRPKTRSLLLSPWIRDEKSVHSIPRAARDYWKELEASLLTPQELLLRLQFEKRPAAAWAEACGLDAALWTHLEKSRVALDQLDKLTPYDGVFTLPEKHRKEIFDRGFSASGLQRLAECSFRFLGETLLRLAPESRSVESGDLQKHAKGKLIHGIFERLYASEQTPDPELLIREAMEECRREAPGLYPLLWKSLGEELRIALKRFVPMEREIAGEFRPDPRWVERDVTGTIDLGKKRLLKLRGTVDRVDLRVDGKKTFFRVLDYKTGNRKKGKLEKAALEGSGLQLPLYLKMVEQMLAGEGVKAQPAGAALLYPLEEDEKKILQALPDDFWETHGADFLKTLNLLWDVMERGLFAIQPDDSDWGYCSHCPFQTVCRKAHWPSRHRAKIDPKLKDYHGLRG